MRKLVATLVIAALPVLSAFAASSDYPPYQNILNAKQRVLAAQVVVQDLVQRISGGGSTGGDRCAQYKDPRSCKAAECQWVVPSSRTNMMIVNGYCRSFNHNGMENDMAANFALIGMGKGLEDLALKIDDATANYGTPKFWKFQGKACNKASDLYQANQAAKVAANLPVIGIVTPNDFFPIDDELNGVRSDLWCH